MPTLLLVHHTPSPALQEMFEAVVSGARTDEIEGVEVIIRPALTGAVCAVESITTGLQWRAVRPPVCVTGPPGKAELEACRELGALVAAAIADLPERAQPRALRRADSYSNKVLKKKTLIRYHSL